MLEASAYDPIAGVAWHPYFGNGRVDASAAVQLAKQSTSFDTLAPSVSVFNPKAGQTVSGVVPVDVSATDNEGVTEVAFYAGGKLVGRDTVAPYQFSWNTRNVPKGTALLQARAWDASGNEGLSVTFSVTVKR